MKRKVMIGAGAAALVAIGGFVLWGDDLGINPLAGSDAGKDLFALDLMPMLFDEKCGYQDSTGKLAINAQFDYADPFLDRSGLAIVSNDGKYGLIDRAGKYVANPQFEDLYTADGDELFWAKAGERWGLVDKGGKYVLNPQFENVLRFDEGGLAVVVSGGKWGMIDKQGKWVIQPQFDAIHASYPGGSDAQLPVYFAKGLAVARLGDQWGYIDRSGKWAINPQFPDEDEFDDSGLAPAAMMRGSGKVWGFIDGDGKWAINPQFPALRPFYDAPYAAVSNDSGDWGYVDTDGRYTINPHFAAALGFDRNSGKWLAAAAERTSDGSALRYGYIDEKGTFAINPQFAFAGPFDGNRRARVRFGENWGLIGPDGTFAVNPTYEFLVDLPGHDAYYFEAEDPSDITGYSLRFGLVDPNGKETAVWTGVPCEEF